MLELALKVSTENFLLLNTSALNKKFRLLLMLAIFYNTTDHSTWNFESLLIKILINPINVIFNKARFLLRVYSLNQ